MPRSSDDLINDFEKANPNIKISSQVVDADTLSAKTRSNCASGNCSDIVHAIDPLYSKSGWLLNLAPYISSAWEKRFIPETLDPLSIGSRLYGVPLEVSPLATIWNAKLIASLGRSIPSTWDQFVELGERAKEKNLYLASFPSSSDLINNLIWGHSKRAGCDGTRAVE